MDFQLFAATISNKSMPIDAQVFYSLLDEKAKKEILLGFKNYRHNILRTINECFNFEGKKNHKFTINFLIDFTKILSKEEAQSYLEAVSDFTYLNQNLYTPQDKSKVVLAFMKAGIDVNSEIGAGKGEQGTPLIHFVAAYCDVSAVKYFVENGAKLNIIDEEQDSVLSSTMLSVLHKPNEKVLKYLLKQKDINYLEGNNILTLALKKGYENMVKVIKQSHLINDEKFLNYCQQTCSKDLWNEFFSSYEKEKLEKMTTKPPQVAQKLKI